MDGDATLRSWKERDCVAVRGEPDRTCHFSYDEANNKSAAHSTKAAEKQRSEPVSVLRQATPKRCNPAYSLSALVLH